MTRLQQIKQWILENHEHHADGERIELDMKGNSKHIEGTSECIDGNSPYVNSIRLEDLVDKLIEEEENESR